MKTVITLICLVVLAAFFFIDTSPSSNDGGLSIEMNEKPLQTKAPIRDLTVLANVKAALFDPEIGYVSTGDKYASFYQDDDDPNWRATPCPSPFRNEGGHTCPRCRKEIVDAITRHAAEDEKNRLLNIHTETYKKKEDKRKKIARKKLQRQYEIQVGALKTRKDEYTSASEDSTYDHRQLKAEKAVIDDLAKKVAASKIKLEEDLVALENSIGPE